ncbi:MAG: HEAT repeat domain-containing protein [Planctomycetota bacterium]|jgi:hypothetical protein
MRTLLIGLLVASPFAQLEEALVAKNTERAVELLARVPDAFESATKAEKLTALRLIGKAAASKNAELRLAAISTLGTLRAKGTSKYLKRWLSPKRNAKASETHLAAINAAGKIADSATLKLLRKQAEHPDTEVATTATMALGGYHILDPRRRKALAFKLIRRLEGFASLRGGRGRRGGGNPEEDGLGRDRGDSGKVVRVKRLAIATIMALRELAGVDLRTLPQWQQWRKDAKGVRNPFA